MKNIRNGKELVQKTMQAGMKYGEPRGVAEFEPTDSSAEKIEHVYHLLAHDKVMHPLPEDPVSQQAMRHKLVIRASKLK